MSVLFVEAGFDPPAKLACWLHPPFGRTHSLIRCGIRCYVQPVRLKHQKVTFATEKSSKNTLYFGFICSYLKNELDDPPFLSLKSDKKAAMKLSAKVKKIL